MFVNQLKSLNGFSFLLLGVSVLMVEGCSKSSSNSPSPSLLPIQTQTSRREIEFIDPSLKMISTQKTTYERAVANSLMVPRGSSFRTPPGNLFARGIFAIIHAAPGSMTRGGPMYSPTLEGVESAVLNSMVLANRFNHKKVAIPLIGGNIFSSALGVSADELARVIISTALQNRGQVEIVFIDIDPQNFLAFQRQLAQLLVLPQFVKHAAFVTARQGDITQAGLADVIVNAANMEMTFGGGVSGFIGNATGRATEINAYAQTKIRILNTKILEELGTKDSMPSSDGSGSSLDPYSDPSVSPNTVDALPAGPGSSSGSSSSGSSSSGSSSSGSSSSGSSSSGSSSSGSSSSGSSSSGSSSSGSSSSGSSSSGSSSLGPEIEHQDPTLNVISTRGIPYVAAAQPDDFPQGSAIRVGSGRLALGGGGGITAIIHSVFGQLQPTLDNLRRSVENVMILAERFGHQRIVIPIIGAQVFQTAGINQRVLLDTLVQTTLTHRQNVFVVFIDNTFQGRQDLQQALDRALASPAFAAHRNFARVIQGDITLFADHQGDVIVNSANIKAELNRGGLSTVIGGAVHTGDQVNQATALLARRFNQLLLARLGSVAPVLVPPPAPAPIVGLGGLPPGGPVAGGSGADPLYVEQPGPAVTPNPLPGGLRDVSSECFQYLSGDYKQPNDISVAVLSVATESKQKMVWYRWGNGVNEYKRVGLSPAFYLGFVNFERIMAQGRGLYVAGSPLASVDYGADAGRAAGLVTVVAPEGTPIIDINKAGDRAAVAGLGLNLNVLKDCPIPVMVKYTADQLTLGDEKGQHAWWVLKSNKDVVIDRFDGRYLTTKQLFDYKTYIEERDNDVLMNVFWTRGAQPTLSSRIYNPTRPQQIPVSYTSMVPYDEWGANPTLRTVSVPSTVDPTVQHFWRYDGSCGSYLGGIVLRAHDEPHANCRADFPTEYRLINGECFEVVQGDRDRRIRVGGRAMPRSACH